MSEDLSARLLEQFTALANSLLASPMDANSPNLISFPARCLTICQ